MILKSLFFITSLITISLSLQAHSKPVASNITVIGSVFCDSCSENTFSKHSYFLQGARVQLQCRFKQSSTSRRYRSITAQETTDKYGVYKFDIPPVLRFKCRQRPDIKNSCRATLIGSLSSLCNHTGIQASTTHFAIKPKTSDNLCIFNLNALSYKPPNRDASYCGVQNRPLSTGFDSSLFFWPLFPPFGLPWLHWPPLPFTFRPLPFPFPFPFPDPSSFPFSLPPWLRFLDPSSLPFPFSLLPPLFPPFTPAPSLSPPSPPWP